jgi:transposase
MTAREIAATDEETNEGSKAWTCETSTQEWGQVQSAFSANLASASTQVAKSHANANAIAACAGPDGEGYSDVTKIGCDETSARRGQDYVSLFMDLEIRRVMFATPGKDAETVKAFAEDLAAHGGAPKTQVKEVCCDMSPAFISGIGSYLAEQPEKESTVKADTPASAEEAEAYLRRWCYGAKRSRLEPIKEFVATVEAHWDGIIAWQQSRLSNGLLEGTNSLVQAAKRRARGYRSKAKMITIIYLIAGKLPLPQIHTI